MIIQVLGSGCPTCKKLYGITQEVVDELKTSEPLFAHASVEYITGMDGTKRIIELGAMSSPVLVVNNTIAMTGFTPNKNAIKQALINKA